jgi:hypothetical protein
VLFTAPHSMLDVLLFGLLPSRPGARVMTSSVGASRLHVSGAVAVRTACLHPSVVQAAPAAAHCSHPYVVLQHLQVCCYLYTARWLALVRSLNCSLVLAVSHPTQLDRPPAPGCAVGLCL